MAVFSGPPGVSVKDNMKEAYQRRMYFGNGGDAFLYSWFYSQVRNRARWDFKQQGVQYEVFGNFHYGAVGTAAGFTAQVLLRAAGAAQTLAGTRDPDFGHWWGAAPFGDDFRDQHWIKEGIAYAQCHGY